MVYQSHAITRTVCARIPTAEGEFHLCHFENTRDGREHLALLLGDVRDGENVLVRVHSECFTGDVLGSRRCDCGPQLHEAMRQIADAGRGVIVYLRQEGRGIGLAQKLRAYNLQDEGYDTVEANLLLGHQADERDYWAAAAILAELRVRSINLLTNNPAKIEHLRTLGVRVLGRTPVLAPVHADNHGYLTTKVQRMRHMLELPEETPQDEAEFPPAVQAALDALVARMRDHDHSAQRPFVTLTYAQSLDGSIAAQPGAPLALSSAASLRLTHALRAAHNAILVGVGTVLADDPSLTVRLVDGPQPQPVVLDTRLRVPDSARLLRHPRAPWLAAAPTESAPESERRVRLERQGATVMELPAHEGQIDLSALLRALARRGIRSVMVEGGAQVIGAFLRSRLVDAVVLTLAPRFVGGLVAVDGSSPGAPLPYLEQPLYTPLGSDLLVWGAPAWPTANEP